MDSYIRVYYQDFMLNNSCFKESDLSLNEAKSALVLEMSLDALRNAVEPHGLEIGSNPTQIDICEILFNALNNFPMEVANMSQNFKHIGHTSMSIGDYVVFKPMMKLENESEVIMCASVGWKEIGNFQKWGDKRDAVIAKMFDAPIDVIVAMYETLSKDAPKQEFYAGREFYEILNQEH